jgi:hypothetical protein
MTEPRPVGLHEAAAALGLSAEAVRMRLRRGSLAGEKAGRTWRVYLPGDAAPPVAATGQPPVATEPRPDSDHTALLAELRADVGFLRAELERRGVELAEMRRLLAMHMPALPAATVPATPAERPASAPNAADVAQTTPRRWRRFWRA